MRNDTNSTLTLDGQLYAMSDLPQVARDTLISIQFVETRLQQLRGELAVIQTAHVAYARALKVELDQTQSTRQAITPPP
jgi:ABC-type siderophore export system fused ATPase/permease subunit